VIVGASRYEVPGVRSKEGDQGFKPRSRMSSSDWPSLMIEVGVSESINILRYDACWWLLNSGGHTNIVVIISIRRSDRSIVIGRWERMPLTHPTRPTSNVTVPTKVQRVLIDQNSNVTCAPLIIPIAKLLDTVPPGANNLTFNSTAMGTFANDFWSVAQ
jgi:hypothetical protein